MADAQKALPEAMLRSIFQRPDLTVRDIEQFVQDMMAGREELTITWEDICAMARLRIATPEAPGERQPVGWLVRGEKTYLYVDSAQKPGFVYINGTDPVVSIEPRYGDA